MSGLGSSGVTLASKVRAGGRKFVDCYRHDDYDQDGHIQTPFKSIDGAISTLPLPEVEDIEAFLNAQTASKEFFPVLDLAPGVYGDFVIDRPLLIDGHMGSVCNAGTITVDGIVGMVILKGITAELLHVKVAGVIILQECTFTNVITEDKDGYLIMVATDVQDTLEFVGQYLAMQRECTINNLAITLDTNNGTLVVKNSEINGTFAITQTDSELITMTFVNSYLYGSYTASGFETITNMNSVLENATLVGADSYVLKLATPGD